MKYLKIVALTLGLALVVAACNSTPTAQPAAAAKPVNVQPAATLPPTMDPKMPGMDMEASHTATQKGVTSTKK